MPACRERSRAAMDSASTLQEAYRSALRQHGYEPDPAQEHAVARLDDLRLRLQAAASAPAGFSRLLSRLSGRQAVNEPVRGLYLWGGVGRGKTFLLDLFQANLTVPSRREHFHRFMKDVHDRLRLLQNVPDPLQQVAHDMSRECRVLCLDELFVSDIGDAMLLSGLFGGLISNGVTLLFTSNTPPNGLYRDGLQRARFLPAIKLLEEHTEILEIDSGQDYRLRQLEKAPLYFYSGDADCQASMRDRFRELAGYDGTCEPITIEGRSISVLARTGDTIWFSFTALCDGPRSQSDYVELSREHRNIFVSDVPVFTVTLEDQARRFVALVDELYDRNVKLVISASTVPDRLYQGDRLRFEFARTCSRLIEMQSRDYLARPHRP